MRAPGPRTDYRSESTAAIRVSASTGPSISPADALDGADNAAGAGAVSANGTGGGTATNGAGGALNGASGSGGAQGGASTDTAGRITKQDVNRITGMADYDGLGAMVWVYE